MNTETKEISIKPVIHNGSLYDYSAGCYCGVLVKESTMKKLVKLQNDHLQKVKSLLTDHADKGNVFSSHWTLHHPEGKQTNVRFIDESKEVHHRIKTATTSHQPTHHKLVFIANGMKEAKQMADSHHSAK